MKFLIKIYKQYIAGYRNHLENVRIYHLRKKK